MLLEFSTKNFRSFRDQATLSFAASPDASRRDTHCLATGLKAIPWLLSERLLTCQRERQKQSDFRTWDDAQHGESVDIADRGAVRRVLYAFVSTRIRPPTDGLRDKPTNLGGSLRSTGLVMTGSAFAANGSPFIEPARDRAGLTVKWDEDLNEERWGTFSTHFTGPRETLAKSDAAAGALSQPPPLNSTASC